MGPQVATSPSSPYVGNSHPSVQPRGPALLPTGPQLRPSRHPLGVLRPPGPPFSGPDAAGWRMPVCVQKEPPCSGCVCPLAVSGEGPGEGLAAGVFPKRLVLAVFPSYPPHKTPVPGGSALGVGVGPGAGPCQEAPGPRVTPSSQDIRSDSTQHCSGASRSPESLRCPGRGRCVTSGICGCRRTHRGGGLPRALGDGDLGGSEIRGTHGHSPG